jgi:hypothetical protein
MKTIFRIIEQTDYDRYVFLTEQDGKIVGLNYHQGIGDLHPDYYEADNLLTSIYESLTTFSTEERIIKAIELHQKITIFNDVREFRIGSEQRKLVRKALAHYRECITKFSDVVTDSQSHDLYDLLQLEGMFHYSTSVELNDYEFTNFTRKHGIDPPIY